jgi:hypothetical protein
MAVIYGCSQYAIVCVRGKPFQPSLMFVYKTWAYQLNSTVDPWPYLQASRLERLNKDKRYSLLQKSVYYGRKKFYRIGPWPSFTALQTCRA